MKIKCPACSTSYTIDADKIPPGGAKVRCKKCSARFSVSPPSGVPATPRPDRPVQRRQPPAAKSGAPENAAEPSAMPPVKAPSLPSAQNRGDPPAYTPARHALKEGFAQGMTGMVVCLVLCLVCFGGYFLFPQGMATPIALLLSLVFLFLAPVIPFYQARFSLKGPCPYCGRSMLAHPTDSRKIEQKWCPSCGKEVWIKEFRFYLKGAVKDGDACPGCGSKVLLKPGALGFCDRCKHPLIWRDWPELPLTPKQAAARWKKGTTLVCMTPLALIGATLCMTILTAPLPDSLNELSNQVAPVMSMIVTAAFLSYGIYITLEGKGLFTVPVARGIFAVLISLMNLFGLLLLYGTTNRYKLEESFNQAKAQWKAAHIQSE